MPSGLSNSPFLALRADEACGRAKAQHKTSAPFSSLSISGPPAANGYANGHTNGYTNGHSEGTTTTNGITGNTPYTNGTPQPNHHDEFLKLDQPQQDVLLLHGPRQKYSLEKAQEIPELRADREILIQVLAIGLNPVDWKGADYGK